VAPAPGTVAKMTRVEQLVRDFANERTLADAYRALEREHLRRARELELSIERAIKRKPLTTRDRNRLIKLLETGELVYEPNDGEAPEPF
jgi:hypothetical protein